MIVEHIFLMREGGRGQVLVGRPSTVVLPSVPPSSCNRLTPPLQFNVASWLDSYGPSLAERSQMLDFISQGLILCGPKPSQEGNMLVEVCTTIDSRWKTEIGSMCSSRDQSVIRTHTEGSVPLMHRCTSLMYICA